eukprot:5964362-Prymnesium_polylepis.1
MVAAYKGHAGVLTECLRHGSGAGMLRARATAGRFKGLTPLQISRESGHSRCTQLLEAAQQQ